MAGVWTRTDKPSLPSRTSHRSSTGGMQSRKRPRPARARGRRWRFSRPSCLDEEGRRKSARMGGREGGREGEAALKVGYVCLRTRESLCVHRTYLLVTFVGEETEAAQLNAKIAHPVCEHRRRPGCLSRVSRQTVMPRLMEKPQAFSTDKGSR